MTNVRTGEGVFALDDASVNNVNISVSDSGSVSAIYSRDDYSSFNDFNISFTNVESAYGINGAGSVHTGTITFDGVASGTGVDISSYSYTGDIKYVDITADNSGSIYGIYVSPDSSFDIYGGSFTITNSTSARGIYVSAGGYNSVDITEWTADINVTGIAFGIDAYSTGNGSCDVIYVNVNVVSTEGDANGVECSFGQTSITGGTINVTGKTSADGVIGGSGPGYTDLNLPEIVVTSNGLARGVVGKKIDLGTTSVKVKGSNSSNTVGFYWGSDGGAQVTVPSGKTLRSRTISGGYTEFYAG